MPMCDIISGEEIGNDMYRTDEQTDGRQCNALCPLLCCGGLIQHFLPRPNSMPTTRSFTAVANQEIPYHYVATSASVLTMWHSGCAQIVCN